MRKKPQDPERALGHEIHRWCGFTRFVEGEDGILRARITPEHEVLESLALFFAARLRGQRWSITDAVHARTVVFDGSRYLIRPARPEDLPKPRPEADPVEGLWQEYFRTIAIPERRNLSLQQRCLPQKYRQDLIELFPGTD